MGTSLIRLADVPVGQPGADYITGFGANEIVLPTIGLALTNQVVDTGLMWLPGRIKALAIFLPSAITQAAQQATVQLFAARTIYGTAGSTGIPQSAGAVTNPTTPYLGSVGAASSFPTGNVPNACQLVGPAVNFGPSGTSIGAGIYWFTTTSPGNPSASPPTSMTELTQPYTCLGVEIKFPAAPSGAPAAYTVLFTLAPV